METYFNNQLYKMSSIPRLLLGLGSIVRLIKQPERQGNFVSAP